MTSHDLPLSNGILLVVFDLQSRIRDVHFPHVGVENHAVGHPIPVNQKVHACPPGA